MSARDDLLAGTPVRFSPGAPDVQRTVEAVWIEEAVRATKAVHIEHGIVIGVLNLKYAGVEKELRLQDCEIQERADFSYSRFKQVADFSGSVFKVGPDFRNSSFEYELVLERAQFLTGEARWAHVAVSRALQAQGVVFGDAVNANFDDLACGAALFNRATFGGEALFRNAHIQGTGKFSGAIFHKLATFEGARVDDQFLFRIEPDDGLPAARFQGEANFIGVTVGSLPSFRGGVFEKGARVM